MLAFAGTKMLLGKWGIEIAPFVSVGMITVTIGVAVVASMLVRRDAATEQAFDELVDLTTKERRRKE